MATTLSIAERQTYIQKHLAREGIVADFHAEGANPCCNRKRSYSVSAFRQTADGQIQTVKKVLRPNFKGDRTCSQLLRQFAAA
jgi:hypothetical protein